jgi:hypothetical protein
MPATLAETIHRRFTEPVNFLWIYCEYFACCSPATRRRGQLGGLHSGLFAYNETPTIAVAIDCWFRARQQLTRPFLWLASPLSGPKSLVS